MLGHVSVNKLNLNFVIKFLLKVLFSLNLLTDLFFFFLHFFFKYVVQLSVECFKIVATRRNIE